MLQLRATSGESSVQHSTVSARERAVLTVSTSAMLLSDKYVCPALDIHVDVVFALTIVRRPRSGSQCSSAESVRLHWHDAILRQSRICTG
jgi:hypothetical protein